MRRVVLGGYALVALLAPVLLPAGSVDPVTAAGPLLAPPSTGYPLGTDPAGRSVLALTLWGTRWTLLLALAATALAVGAGTAAGIVSGHFGLRAADRITEWFLVLPRVPTALVLAAVLPPTGAQALVAIAVTSWAGAARVVRTAVLSVEAQPYLDRVRALGAGHCHQLRHHVLPAVRRTVAAIAALTLADAALAEATLSYLGLGDPGRVTWGSMLHDAALSGAVTAGAWWYLLPPGLALVGLILAVHAEADAR